MSGFGYPQLSFLFYCTTQAFIAPEVIEKAIEEEAKLAALLGLNLYLKAQKTLKIPQIN